MWRIRIMLNGLKRIEKLLEYINNEVYAIEKEEPGNHQVLLTTSSITLIKERLL